MEKAYQTCELRDLTSKLDQVPIDNRDRKEGIALVNVLEPKAFEREHIPGSINIPEGKLEEFERRFDKDKEIIVYCASTKCQASPTTAKELAERGFSKVVDFEAGMLGWKAGGMAVATGAAAD